LTSPVTDLIMEQSTMAMRQAGAAGASKPLSTSIAATSKVNRRHLTSPLFGLMYIGESPWWCSAAIAHLLIARIHEQFTMHTPSEEAGGNDLGLKGFNSRWMETVSNGEEKTFHKNCTYTPWRLGWLRK
jgi:hypothetical protein